MNREQAKYVRRKLLIKQYPLSDNDCINIFGDITKEAKQIGANIATRIAKETLNMDYYDTMKYIGSPYHAPLNFENEYQE